MYISNNQIVRRIRLAARNYKNHLVGKTFMFVYENTCLEVMFTTRAFFHLTGVNSTLSAVNFYKHAVQANTLRSSEIYFDTEHPFDLADLKTRFLQNLYRMTVTEVFIVDNILTATACFDFGLTDLEMVLCLGRDTDKHGNVISNRWIPYSFRIENIDNRSFDNLFEVLWTFEKNSNDTKYNRLSYGNINDLENIPETIKSNLDIDKIIANNTSN